jgi:5'-methylthioadenosine phosphorylase
MAKAKIGIIGGSGLYEMEGLIKADEIYPDTPFGRPSDVITVGNIQGVEVAFLARHGKGHRISPSAIPARANIYALKQLGVEQIISVSAVGSLKEKICPGHIIIPDQIIDFTRGRKGSFFDEGIVVHISLASPFCPVLSHLLWEEAKKLFPETHLGGTYITIEGPSFSTRAESNLYRSFGDIISMTAQPEARLAREAEICYATLCLTTDYDSWHEGQEAVSTKMVLQNLKEGVEKAKRIIAQALPLISKDERKCSCQEALRDAIATSPRYIPPEVKERLSLILAKYL